MKHDVTRRVASAVLTIASFSATHAAICDGVSPTANTTVETVKVTTGLTGRPLYVVSPPGDVDRIFIVEQSGFIRIHKRGNPPTTTSLFLDISAKVQANTFLNEMGLLSLVFDPDYATNGRFYVNYTEGPLSGPYASVLARYVVSANPDVADATSELRVMRYAQPESNHKSGQMIFGPDGFLYLWTGDGGGGGDLHGTCGNGENLSAILGKILRIDVRNIDPLATAPECPGVVTPPYKIPFANPFRDGPGSNCGEIFAYGLRNAWRNAFDFATGNLYVADVGQNCWEEVNFLASPGNGGQNFGWRQMEGNHCFDPNNQSNCTTTGVLCAGSPACNDPSFIYPVVEFGHTGSPAACSVTGGYAYRGCRMTQLQGNYFYGDFCAGWIRSFLISGGVPTNPLDWTTQIDPAVGLPNNLTSFGEDAQREIYVIRRAGEVWRISPPFTSLETSGIGASRFQLNKGSDWTWEDVARTNDRPVSFYRVYRGVPNGAFTCVLKVSTPFWPGGDPVDPGSGQLFAYVVTAWDGTRETATGHPGTFDASTCP
jgi:glucose/arabinose dehydrogenase